MCSKGGGNQFLTIPAKELILSFLFTMQNDVAGIGEWWLVY